MAARMMVLAGPARSGKTDRALDRYREVLAYSKPGGALWLAPNWPAVEAVRARLLAAGLRGCFAPGVTTFARFAGTVVATAPNHPRSLDRFLKRQIVRRLIDRQRSAGRLEHFQGVAGAAGLADLVCDFIAELKRREIWPDDFRRACSAPRPSPKDRDVVALYQAYQECLLASDLYDPQGLFWKAHAWLAQGRYRAADRPRLVVVDGFADFTRSQHNILQWLSTAAEHILVTLPIERGAGRAHLFSKPRATLAELRRRHKDVEVEYLDRPPRPTSRALAHIEANLFGDPRHNRPAPDTRGVEILAASGQVGEIELIGRRIKQLLLDGDPETAEAVRPDDVAVVFRSLSEEEPLVGEVFGRLGIPVALSSQRPLLRTPMAAALVRLLESGLSDRQPDGPVAALFDRLPRRAAHDDWLHAWEQLARAAGLLRDEADAVQWDRIREMFRSAATVSGWIGEPAGPMDRKAAAAELIDVLRSAPVREPAETWGRVRVISAPEARSIEAAHLFVAGLAERAFPALKRNGRLYAEDEYQRLIAAGLPLPARGERIRDEMLLFYEVVTRATRRLYLSYPAWDESAQPLSPSPFLQEVERVCGKAIERTERADLRPVRDTDEPLSAEQRRVTAVARALEGDVSLLAGLLDDPVHAPMADNLAPALRLTRSRQDRDRFGPAEGILEGEAARAELARRFGPATIFSPSELERYAACPFRFFLERLVGVQPAVEEELTIDFASRGRRLHDVLATLHERINEQHHGPTAPADLDEDKFAELSGQTLAEVLGGQVPDDPAEGALAEVDRRLIARWLAGYAHQHRRYEALWKGFAQRPLPSHFEVSFGLAHGHTRPPSTNTPLEIHTLGKTVLLSGRIDRIDVGTIADRTAFVVIDYKTGHASRIDAETVAQGLALQLPLYAIAAERLLPAQHRPLPWQVGSWRVRDRGYSPRKSLRMHALKENRLEPLPEWQAVRRLAEKTVVRLVEAMRRGLFPVSSTDDHCTGRCPFHTICRINHVRSLEKSWHPSQVD